jgi:hypothetical protein
MALGDSITAGLFAEPTSNEVALDRTRPPSHHDTQHVFPGVLGFEEYRGVSFSTGGDRSAVTLSNVSVRAKLWYTIPCSLTTLLVVDHTLQP